MRLVRALNMLFIGLSVLVLASCASLPQSSPVGESDQQTNTSRDIAYTFNPAGPATDATATSIIQGFILAATGIQGDFSTAREFLTETAAETWDPYAQTTIYTGRPLAEAVEDDKYTVELVSVGSLNDAGVLTLADDGTIKDVRFSLIQVDGQWRIDELPDGIHLDAAQFRALFNTQTLYFYDPTYAYVVPDVRWMLNTSDQTTTIVNALLDGPADYLEGAVVTAFPKQAALYRETIPVSNYTAQIDFTDKTFQGVSELARHRMFQQLELTLQRYPGISDIRMTRERTGLNFDTPPNGFTPAITTVTTGNSQIGIHPDTGKLVSFEASSIAALQGFPNVANLEPTDPTMNRERDAAAFVNADRDTMYIATNTNQAYEVATGTDLIAPSMDVHDWVFTVTDGDTILAANTNRTGQVLEIMHPWAGRNSQILALRISPEGTRAAVIIKPQDEPAQLYIAGLIRDNQSRPQALGNSFKMQTEQAPNKVLWYSSAEVLTGRLSPQDRVELEQIGFSGPSTQFKPMLGMINFSTGAGNIYAETEDNVYLRVGSNWRVQSQAPTQLSYPG